MKGFNYKHTTKFKMYIYIFVGCAFTDPSRPKKTNPIGRSTFLRGWKGCSKHATYSAATSLGNYFGWCVCLCVCVCVCACACACACVNFFNVLASGGLYSLIYINNLQS